MFKARKKRERRSGKFREGRCFGNLQNVHKLQLDFSYNLNPHKLKHNRMNKKIGKQSNTVFKWERLIG